MYDFITSQKDYTLFKNHIGIYKITHNGIAVAHPTTEEQAFEKLGQLAGITTVKPSCFNWCRIHNCIDCERYFD